MPSISSHLSGDHRRCDELFMAAERAVASNDAAAALPAHEAFTRAMAHHFAMEEEVLFPAFEQVMGNSGGPTGVMRHEHRQVRQLFEFMERALGRGDGESFLSAAETLLILMQQHNAKEEQILYPMIERSLPPPELDSLLKRMEEIAG